MRRISLAMVIVCSISASVFAQDNKELQRTNLMAPDLNKILETERSVLGTLHLAPITVPEGEQVGDIISVATTTLIARGEDCFDGLLPRVGPSSLPAMTIQSERGMEGALGVSGVGVMAGSAGGVKTGTSFVLDFKDVQVYKVSLVQLRKSLRRNVAECGQVEPFIDAFSGYIEKSEIRRKITSSSKGGDFKSHEKSVDLTAAFVSKLNDITKANGTIITDKPPPLLLGTVFTARRVIRVKTSNSIDAKAKLNWKQKILEDLGLGLSFQIVSNGDTESSNSVEIESKEIVPVAFAPAFFVQNTKHLADGRTQYEVANVDSDAVDSAVILATELSSKKSILSSANDLNKIGLNNPNISGDNKNLTPSEQLAEVFKTHRASIIMQNGQTGWSYTIWNTNLKNEDKLIYSINHSTAEKREILSNILGIAKTRNIFIIE